MAPNGNGGSTHLMQAVKAGCVGLLPILAKESIGKKDDHGFTALMYNALIYEQILDPVLLREAGEISANGKSALLYALEKGNTGIAEALIDREALIPDPDGCLPIIYAIRYGHEGLALKLWDKLSSVGINLYNTTTEGAKTLDMWAAEYGMLQLLRKYIKENSALCDTFCDIHGHTALMYAARAGHADCVAELRFFSLAARDSMGMTALMHAAKHGHANCVRILIGGYITDDNSTIGDSTGLISSLSIGKQDNQGRTALHHAILSKSSQCLRLLISERNICDNYSFSGSMYIFRSCILQIYLKIAVFSVYSSNIDIYSIITAEKVIKETHDHFLRKENYFKTAMYALLDSLFSALMDDLEPLMQKVADRNCKPGITHRAKSRSIKTNSISWVTQYIANCTGCMLASLPVSADCLCCSCNTNLSSYLIFPCKHLCFCSACILSIGGSCPICLKAVLRAEEVLLEGS